MIKSIPIEGWPDSKKTEVLDWMKNTFEKSVWGVQHDYGLETLWMSEEAYTLFLLRWS